MIPNTVAYCLMPIDLADAKKHNLANNLVLCILV